MENTRLHQARHDWVRSHDHFYLTHFSMILMTYEALYGAEGCRRVHTRTCGCRGLDESSGWIDEGRWPCPGRQVSGETETVSQREQKGHEHSQRISPRKTIWIKVNGSQKHTACGNTRDRDCQFKYQTTSL